MTKKKVGSATVVDLEPTKACIEKEAVTFIEGQGKGGSRDWTTVGVVEGSDLGIVANWDAQTTANVVDGSDPGVVANQDAQKTIDVADGSDPGVMANRNAQTTADVSDGSDLGGEANQNAQATADVVEGRGLDPTAFWLLLAEACYEAWQGSRTIS